MSQHLGAGTVRVCLAATRIIYVALFALILTSSAHAQTLPSGWAAADIGAPARAGSSTYSSGTFTVTGGGVDVWGTSDQFRYVYRQVTGDVNVVARVASLQAVHDWSKAGIMIRSSLAANSAYSFLLVSGSRGIGLQGRPAAGQNAVGFGATQGTAPAWVKLERRGTAITAFRSTNGTTWTMIANSSLTLPSSFYVGIAVTAHSPTGTARAQFTNVTVGSATTTNPPTVSLSSPTAGATFAAPASINIAANAADTDNGVALVEFYANGTLLGTDASSPYTFAWPNVAAGTYNLTAIARDNGGLTTTSAARSISVGGSTSNTPPTVSLSAPANGATYAAPASMTISANASDTNGSIVQVDFYAGSLLVGSDTTSPYSVTWNYVATGSYSLTAVARDNGGATTTSAARSVTVGVAPALTRAVFGPSADHSTVTYMMDVFTAGANPATATPIARQNLGRPAVVGGECSVDVAATISGLPGGNYFATVVAVGSSGTSTRATSEVFGR